MRRELRRDRPPPPPGLRREGNRGKAGPSSPRSRHRLRTNDGRAELLPPLSHSVALPRTLPDGEGEVSAWQSIFTENHCGVHSLNPSVASNIAGEHGGSPGPDPRGPTRPAPGALRRGGRGSRCPGKSICPRPEPRREPPAPTALQQRGGERSSIVKLPAVGTRKINIIRNHCNWDCEI